MKKFAIIFYFLYGNCLVSGFPLSQLLQAQTCPYNQDFNALLQQALPHLYQLPSNNNPYHPQVMVENDMPPWLINGYDVPPNNQINSKENKFKKLYAEKILSNPTIQGILDSTQKHYSPIVEYPNHLPQVVNYFFIISPELFNIEEDCLLSHNETKNDDIRNQNKSKRKRKKNKDVTENIDDQNIIIQAPKENDIETEITRNSRQNDNVRELSQIEEENNKRPNRRERERSNYRSANNENFQTNERKTRRRPNRRKQSNDNNNQPVETDPTNEMNPKEKTKQTNEEASENCENAMKPEEDSFIEEMKNKFPYATEDVLNEFSSYYQDLQSNQPFDFKKFYNSDLTYPIILDNCNFQNNRPANQNNQRQNNQRPSRPDRQRQNNQRMPQPDRQQQNNQKTSRSQQSNKKQNNKPRRTRTNNRRNKKARAKPSTSNKSTTAAPSTICPTTTEPKLVQHSQSSKPEETYPENVIETTTCPITPALGLEDVVEDVNNGLDDYYPDFSHDNIHDHSDEMQFIRNHRDYRYHYINDRNEESKIHNDADNLENVIMKPTSVEKLEVVQYRTPPLLENPDFITKQIKKSTPTERKTYDKSSNYSDVKTIKDVKSTIDKSKKSETEIETVYAHSRVLKFNKNDDHKEGDIPVVTYYIPDNMEYEEDGKTVIIAKSIPADHFW